MSTTTATASTKPADNPLLFEGDHAPYDRIQASHVEPAMKWLLLDLEERLVALESNESSDLATLLRGLEEISDRAEKAWGAVDHLVSVATTDELRTAHEGMQPEVVTFFIRMGQSPALYQRFRAIRDDAAFDARPEVERRIVEATLREAKLAGVGLDGEAQARFNEISTEMAELSTKFSNNVLDSTKAFELILKDKAEVDGLPASFLGMAAQSARSAGHEAATPEDGPWRVGLDIPSYLPVMKHGKRRDLREKLHRAFVTRASSGDLDNAPLIDRILALREERSALLGYANHAEVSLATKMADSVEAVSALQEELLSNAKPAADVEFEQLQLFAAEGGAEEGGKLAHWDVAYWSERLREDRFDLDEEALRPYFPLPRVLSGMFWLANKLFEIDIEEADGDAPVWDEHVRFFHVKNKAGERIASFFLDAYARPENKRGGAWMNSAVGRSKNMAAQGQAMRLPTAYLVCNQSPPVDGKPSLMSFNEVNTLFHEFGHGLQHMLTTVDHGLAAGISGIEWDAVELPSQFMENWVYESDVMAQISGHFKTGLGLPEAELAKLRAARTFQSGAIIIRQLNFGMIDMELHSTYRTDSEQTVLDVQNQIAERASILPPLAEARFLCGFSHIFAGGYSAGYYSYKWAEVLSADAFAAFEEAGLENDEEVRRIGRTFRDTVLSMGGARHPMDVFKDFRGREPSTKALLRHAGLVS
ncbi:MAG: oligopeptidase A [Planctomycetota bacterium]|jgi:oligopeptidase A